MRACISDFLLCFSMYKTHLPIIAEDVSLKIIQLCHCLAKDHCVLNFVNDNATHEGSIKEKETSIVMVPPWTSTHTHCQNRIKLLYKYLWRLPLFQRRTPNITYPKRWVTKNQTHFRKLSFVFILTSISKHPYRIQRFREKGPHYKHTVSIMIYSQFTVTVRSAMCRECFCIYQ